DERREGGGEKAREVIESPQGRARPSVMYIWRRRAGKHWLRLRNVTSRFGSALAVIARPGQERLLLEVSCQTERAARDLVREFGGSVERLRPDWLQHFVKRGRHKPLRVGSRLRVLDRPEQRETRPRSIIIPAEAAF